MLKSNNVNLNRTVSRSGKIYKKTNYLYTQPKLFNLIKACKERGLKLGLYTLFIPLFFFDFYKEYIASIDIIFICALAILNYIIRPAVNNNYIKNVSYHTDFKIKFLTKIITIMISSIYRLSFGIISEIGNMYFYNRSFDFVFNSTVVFYSVIASIIVILMLCSVGCTGMVEGYNLFIIDGFEEFFEYQSSEEREELISSGELDCFKKEDIILIPYIKEISHTECALLLFAYSKNTNRTIKIEEVSLVTNDGNAVCQSDESIEIEVLSKWNNSMAVVETFEKSEKWLYNGNGLTLKIQISINKEIECKTAEFFYQITIKGFKGTKFQV
jgi:hypothetical protein